MILMPIVYVTDMDKAVAFYESLGFAVDTRGRSEHWTELRAGDGAVLALHYAGRAPEQRVELALVATEPLENVQERHRDSVTRPVTDEAFGRSLALRDPDGLEIQVNEHERELYTA
jgi:catechol 2,3-dioxygenase-like lactoylglutathione lyase family enzyme